MRQRAQVQKVLFEQKRYAGASLPGSGAKQRIGEAHALRGPA
jgi:hypothetical protein